MCSNDNLKFKTPKVGSIRWVGRRSECARLRCRPSRLAVSNEISRQYLAISSVWCNTWKTETSCPYPNRHLNHQLTKSGFDRFLHCHWQLQTQSLPNSVTLTLNSQVAVRWWWRPSSIYFSFEKLDLAAEQLSPLKATFLQFRTVRYFIPIDLRQ